MYMTYNAIYYTHLCVCGCVSVHACTSGCMCLCVYLSCHSCPGTLGMEVRVAYNSTPPMAPGDDWNYRRKVGARVQCKIPDNTRLGGTKMGKTQEEIEE